jgi:hypothetical protein
MTSNDDDVSYLDIKPENMVPIPPQEKVWAQIGDNLELEYIDWNIIETMAKEFDENHRQGQPKTQSQVMSKLLVLVRDKTRKEHGEKVYEAN